MRGQSSDTWIIFSEEFLRFLRGKWYIISTAAVVIIMLAAMLIVPALTGGGDEPTGGVDGEFAGEIAKLGFVDESGQFPTLAESGPREFAEREEGFQAVTRGDIEWLFVIPQDYMQTGRVEQFGDFQGRFPSNPEGEGIFQSLLSNKLLADQADTETGARILNPANFENFRVTGDGTIETLSPIAEAAGGLLVPIMFAALLGLGLTFGAANMVQSVAEEKESRLAEITITSASPFSIMTGKLLALMAISLIQAAVWIIATAFIIPALFRRVEGLGEFTVSPALWLTIAACFIVGYFLLTALAILVGAIAPSVREANGMASWITLVTWVPLWFMGFLITAPNGLFTRVLSYFPLTAPSSILVRIGVGGDMAWWKIALSLLGVAVLGAIVLWISSRIFRAAILMKGQKFGAHNLWTALRNAS